MEKRADKRKTSLGRRIFKFVAVVVMLAYYPAVMSFVAAEKKLAVCTHVVARVENGGSNVLITNKGLERIVNSNFPDIKGSPAEGMNLNEMEKIIGQSTVVRNCEMYVTAGGVLHVEITQREPIMRVFANNGSYYMDEESFRITAQSGMMAHTVVVNGNVGAIIDFSELVDLCKFINDDRFWKSQIEQIYVTDKQEYMLIPRVGDHIIEFGKTDRMEEKFDMLYNLYAHGWQPREWNTYKKVNLKYKGQIVCTKR